MSKQGNIAFLLMYFANPSAMRVIQRNCFSEAIILFYNLFMFFNHLFPPPQVMPDSHFLRLFS